MDDGKVGSRKLSFYTCISGKDELEEKLEKCYDSIQQLVGDLSEKEAHDILSSALSKSIRSHEEICMGLLCKILVEPAGAARAFRDLTYISRGDSMNVVGQNTNALILDRFPFLLDSVKTQIVWLIQEMVCVSAVGMDGVIWNLMRQIAGGDVSPKNLWLTEALLDLLSDNRTWLTKHPLLIQSIVYTFLRLIEDHFSPSFQVLRQKEVTYIVWLIREHFIECVAMGRDFVRLLQNISRIPEIETLWKDIIVNPKSLSPQFSGVVQLLQIRTSRRYLQSRLTPDMEKKIVFLTSNVRFGTQKRYQEWFQRQYLATAESQSLRCDLIRFIVGVIHPTNELLCSDIIPRWAVIGWLLTSCTSPHTGANAKLALFYDWLCYDAVKDNIMNIEPAILVMHHSLRTHPGITASLLDFLCRIISSFHPPVTEHIRAGVFNSLRIIQEKRVLESLSPLFDNSKLDKDLRMLIRDTFGEFCTASPLDGGLQIDEPLLGMEELDASVNPSITSSSFDRELTFSDDDDDVPLAKVRLKTKETFESCVDTTTAALKPHIAMLEREQKVLIEELHAEKDNEARCQVMEKLAETLLQDGGDENLVCLATCLLEVLKEQFLTPLLPPRNDINEESLEDSIGRPMFVLVRTVAETPEEDPSRIPLLSLMAEIHSKEPRMGIHVLFFLKASKVAEGRSSVYKGLCEAQGGKDLSKHLVEDMKHCQEEDLELFCWLLPQIYSSFPDNTVQNSDLLNLIVACIDAVQLQDLIWQVMQGAFTIFNKDSVLAILTISLEWETWEQVCVWQLVAAHQTLTLDHIMPLLPTLDYLLHTEALTAIVNVMRNEKPRTELVKQALLRSTNANDQFVVSVLSWWCCEYEEELSEVVSSLILGNPHSPHSSSSSTSSSPPKRKRGKKDIFTVPSTQHLELMLQHLEQLRSRNKHSSFFQRDTMQNALQQVQAHMGDSMKKHFSDLLALSETELEPVTKAKTSGRGGRKGGTKNTRGRQNQTREISESDSDTTDEEEFVRAKPAKKRRKVNAIGSDSD